MQFPFVASVKTSFNGPFCFTSSSVQSPLFLDPVRWHQEFESGPKAMLNIVRKWLAGGPPRGLLKWHYLNEFFTVQVWPEDYWVQKFNLFSIPGSA